MVRDATIRRSTTRSPGRSRSSSPANPGLATRRQSRGRRSSGSASAPSASRRSPRTAASKPTTSSTRKVDGQQVLGQDRVHPRARRHRRATRTSIARRCGSARTRWCSSTARRTRAGRRIATSVYNHNFFTLDRQPTGPDIVVQIPVRAARGAAVERPRRDPRQRRRFLKDFAKGQTVFTEVEGFGATAKDYDFRIENRKTGAGVHDHRRSAAAKVLFLVRAG